MGIPPIQPLRKKDLIIGAKNRLFLIIGVISLVFDLLLGSFFFFWRYVSTHPIYTVISTMTISDTTLPAGYDTDGEIHDSIGTEGYVQFTALNQRLETPSFGAHSSYLVGFDVTALVFYSDEDYDTLVPTFTVIGYDGGHQPLQSLTIGNLALGVVYYLEYSTPSIDHFVFIHSGPAMNFDGVTQALCGIGHITIQVPKEILS